jgi:hypothetical protein
MVTIAEKLKIGQFGAATTKVLVHFHRTGGMAYPHPITVPEQAALLRRKPNAVVSKTHWPGGKRVRGASLKVYCRGDFEIAWRKQAMLRTRPSGLRPPGQGERSHEERAHGQTF